ncbi:fused response regulator/phosphatase [Streptomyces durbertensis]|uniref:Fused response regulator/phosphatase n=1 Tax=Streptomyces durbertensis TaxID=2448886 RepID=A0ABR6ELG5_9ACTN|nr:fused response regulator/phosphatase [Streptomyces durbertensis]MBB1246171.1 fused response regulator/phosphatase [Streptomyces durbertensis]
MGTAPRPAVPTEPDRSLTVPGIRRYGSAAVAGSPAAGAGACATDPVTAEDPPSADPGTVPEDPLLHPADPAGEQQLTVLLVEDDAGDALLVEEAVADGNVPLELHWARSLAEAFDSLRQHRPDCVLLDLHLPDARGGEALERVLEKADGAAVVVLTGLAGEQAGFAAVAAGAQDYLLKNRLEPEVFLRAIRYAIERKRTEQAAAALQAGQLQARENRRLERGLLPTPLLHGDAVRVTSRYQPGRAQTLLGGDFYDVVELPDGSTQAVVGDVSGHGPDAAALGVCLRVAWRSFVLAGARGEALLNLLEEILVAERAGPEIFATLTTLSREPGARELRLMRAGHPGVLLRSPDGAVRLEEVPGGPVLGLLPGSASWPVVPVAAPAGQEVMMFTDGLIEGRIGPGPARLGEHGLVRIADRHRHAPADVLLDEMIGTAQELAAGHGGLADDLAVLHLAWEPGR